MNKIIKGLATMVLATGLTYCCDVKPTNNPKPEIEQKGRRMSTLEDIAQGVVCIKQTVNYEPLIKEKGLEDKKATFYGTAMTLGSINGNTYLITNKHTLVSPLLAKNDGIIYKRTNNKITITEDCALDDTPENDLEAKIVAVGDDKQGDLGMIKTPNNPLLHISKSYIKGEIDTKLGEETYIIGYPKALLKTVTKGIISNKNFMNSEVFDAKATFGNSGSPYFVKRKGLFYLVGIVKATIPTNDKQNAYLTMGVNNKRTMNFIRRNYGK